jgi:hypothetical protein
MTRANLNFIYQKAGEMPRTLFHYQNGDQYPTGIRDDYKILDFLAVPFTPKSFKKWIKDNYRVSVRKRAENKENGTAIEYSEFIEEPAKVENLGEGGQPKIYYTDGFITDYSYCFDENHGDNKVLVYKWAKLIFEGDREKAIKWFKKQK